MEDIKNAKIEKFINDTIMADAVYEILQQSFLPEMKVRQDVQFLAAERLAVEFLRVAWKELEKHKVSRQEEDKIVNNVGL